LFFRIGGLIERELPVRFLGYEICRKTASFKVGSWAFLWHFDGLIGPMAESRPVP
jgi:hypothetical protein